MPPVTCCVCCGGGLTENKAQKRSCPSKVLENRTDAKKEKRNESVICFDQSTNCFSFVQRTSFTMFPGRNVMDVVNRFWLSLNRPLLFSWTALICDPAALRLRFPQTSLGRNRITQKIDFHWVFQMQNSSPSHLIGSFSGLRTESSVTRENLRSIDNEQLKWRDGRVLGRDKLVT